MLFNSIEFLLFFLLSTLIYFITPSRFRWITLLFASCFFYMSLIPYYIIFVLVIAVNDYFSGLLILKYPLKKRLFLIQSIVLNLGILVIFKYYNFFIENLSAVSGLIGWNYSLPLLNLILPIGLSFYVFKSIGYVIDVYRGDIAPERNIGKYTLFIVFYPEILAGPIDRAGNFLPQISKENKFNYTRVKEGLILAVWGLFKKVVIADRISLIVNHVYGNLNDYTGIPLILTAVLFSFQVYFDFSGYSDIAIGCGKILGYDLPQNFNVPFISQSITEFWRRWHITLSNWLRDYLFNPLMIATRYWGSFSITFSLFITFFLAGIWHGAGWTFAVFGALHGGALVYEVLSKKFRKKLTKKLPPRIYDKVCVLIAFSFVTFAFIFFKAESNTQALTYISQMFKGWSFKAGGYALGIGQFQFLIAIITIVTAMFLEIYSAGRNGLVSFIEKQSLAVRWFFYFALVLFILLFGEFGMNSFVYFKF